MAEKKGKEKAAKVEMKHMAIVVELKHGWLWARHSHYMINVVEVPRDLSKNDMIEAMEKAISTAKRLGIARVGKLRVLTAQEVDVVAATEIDKKSDINIKEILSVLNK